MREKTELKFIASKVPKALVKRLDKAANLGGRTRSAEIRLRLERSLAETPWVDAPAATATLSTQSES